LGQPNQLLVKINSVPASPRAGLKAPLMLFPSQKGELAAPCPGVRTGSL